MVRVDTAKWGQTSDALRQASLNAPHPRTRERFLALSLIASGLFNATTCAAHLGRSDETVLAWVHCYNRGGPDSLAYKRTGGSAPLLPRRKRSDWSRSWRPRTRSTTACPATCGP